MGGRRPYGFSHGMSEHVEAEVERIEEAAERVLAGESVWSICTDWNSSGVPTVTGTAWSVQTLTSILTSPRIAGSRTHRGTVVGHGQWKRIVDEDRHDALVAALAPRPSKPRKGRSYPLVGFLICGRCGGPLRSLTRENGGRSYACRNGPGMGGCGGIRIQANGLEAYVRDLICGMLADPVTRAAMGGLAPVGTSGSASNALADLQRAPDRPLHRGRHRPSDLPGSPSEARRPYLRRPSRAQEPQPSRRDAHDAIDVRRAGHNVGRMRHRLPTPPDRDPPRADHGDAGALSTPGFRCVTAASEAACVRVEGLLGYASSASRLP